MDGRPAPRGYVGGPCERADAIAAELARTAAADRAPTVWLVATPALAGACRRRLAAHAQPACLGVSIVTLRQYASRLTAADLRTRLGPAARIQLVSEIVRSAARRGSLGPLEPLDRAGRLVRLLTSRFRALRRDMVPARGAGARLRSTEGADAAAAIGRLYDAYLAQLDRHALVDEEGVLSAAADFAESAGLAYVAIDLPARLAPIESRLVAATVAGAHRVLFALPRLANESPESEGPLLPAAGSRLATCRALVGDADIEMARQADDDRPVGLRVVRDKLFGEPTEELFDDPNGVAVIAGDSEYDVARRVARRIKLGLSTRRFKPTDVVVATPRLASDGPRYAEALREHGVPVRVDAAPALGSAPCVESALALLTVAATGAEHADVLRLLQRTDLVALSATDATGRFASLRAAAERFIRELGAPSGWRYALQQAQRWAQQPDRAENDLARAAPAALLGLTAIDRALATLPEAATALGWVDALDAALRRLGSEGLSSSGDEADHRAADAVEEAAAAIESLDRVRGRAATVFDRRTMLSILREQAEALRLSVDRSLEGRVAIVDASTAIGLPCRELFVVSADESAFAADSIEEAEETRLRFYELACTPTDGLTLAYAALDPRGQPLAPSPYVTEVEALFADGTTRRGARAPLAPRDPDDKPASLAEWRRQAVDQATSGDGRYLASYTQHAGAGQTQGLAHGLAAVEARATGDGFGPWEGMLRTDSVQQALGALFGSEHLWSASQLETLASCPFKFFARYVLRLAAPPDTWLDIDRRRLGSLAHDALAAALASLRDREGDARLTDLPTDDLRRRLTDELQRLSHPERLPPHESSLATIEGRQAATWVERYADQQSAFEADPRWRELPLRPALMEARFGPTTREDPSEDPASTNEPLRLQTPDGQTVLVGGRIDRVDVARVGDALAFAVVDYKTGKGKLDAKFDRMQSGHKLQPLLYALAVRELFFDGAATPVTAGYWGLRRQGFVGPAKVTLATVHDDGRVEPTDAWRDAEEAISRTCGELAASAREGRFPMHNDDLDCGKTCDFRTVCRVGQTRQLGKQPPDTAGGE